MTVGQLREYLSDVDDSTPVRLAFQPSWPLQYHVSEDIRVVRGICYLAEGGQVYDQPYAPKAVFGEGEPEDACSNCDRTAVEFVVENGQETEFLCSACYDNEVPEDVRENARPITEKERSYSVR